MGSEIDIKSKLIIFSKDRAMQLHATLESFLKHCEEADKVKIVIIYKFSSFKYRNSYEILINEFKNKLKVEWILEKDFKVNLLKAITKKYKKNNLIYKFKTFFNQEYKKDDSSIIFSVDDNVFIRNFSINLLNKIIFNYSSVIAFSLRLSNKHNYCYSSDAFQKIPYFIDEDNHLLFNWINQEGDFNYPFDISSSIYKKSFLMPILEKINFSNPNTLESKLSRLAKKYKKKFPNLLCSKKAIAVCIPFNKVQNVFNNRSLSKNNYDVKILNEKFLRGYRLDVEKISNIEPTSCHVEYELEYRLI